MTDPRVRRVLAVAVMAGSAVAFIGLAVLWPRDDPPPLDEAVQSEHGPRPLD